MKYRLMLRGRNVIGSVELPVKTLIAAKALAESWKASLRGADFRLEITNEKGEVQWTL